MVEPIPRLCPLSCWRHNLDPETQKKISGPRWQYGLDKQAGQLHGVNRSRPTMGAYRLARDWADIPEVYIQICFAFSREQYFVGHAQLVKIRQHGMRALGGAREVLRTLLRLSGAFARTWLGSASASALPAWLRLLGSALLTSLYRHHCLHIHAFAGGQGAWIPSAA